MSEAYNELLTISAQLADIGAAAGLLSWDQETNMPPKGAARRAEASSTLSRISHETFTTARVGELIEAAEALTDLDAPAQANVRELRRSYDRECKLPTELVADLAHTRALAHEHWKQARKADNFLHFAPWLEKLLRLKKQVAMHLDADLPPYDVLLDDYEQGMTTEQLQAMFSELRDPAVALVERIRSKGQPAEDLWAQGRFPQAAQREFIMRLLPMMGFDLEAGRVDIAAHPFCSGFGTGDVRLTVRYNDADPRPAIFGLIHEAGHGLYEQGLPPERERQPIGRACSLGLHESQSRMWENLVGRSLPFWQGAYADLQARFPALAGADVQTWHRAVNRVEPSLIRVEADEVTYNLHIILRMELEIAMMEGELEVPELPHAWNTKIQEYLGITPPSDADGVLQDIHWSMGAIGYFPTYSLGNIYAAQMWKAMANDLDLDGLIRAGDLHPIRDWTRAKVHVHGAQYLPEEVVTMASGSPPSAQHLVDYLETKFSAIYEL